MSQAAMASRHRQDTGVAAAIALAVIAAVAPAGGAGQIAPATLEMRAAEWRAAALAHTSGQFDQVAAGVARWPSDLTRLVVDHAIRRARAAAASGGNQPVAGPEYDATVLVKALVLHTDIAIAERVSGTGAAAASGGWTLLDARPIASVRLSSHWGFARLLAIALTKDPASASIGRTWFRAVGALYQQWADLGQLREHLTAAAEHVPEDPVLLLCEGALHQAYADPRVQSYLTPLRNGQPGSRDGAFRTPSIGDAGTELGIAERVLRRALANDPSLAEARVRLAHVLSARGKAAEAAALARQTLAAPLPSFVEYYGAMVLGRAEAQLGHPAEARVAFERAAARYPHSQAARVALSRLDLAAGHAAEAVEALVRMLGSGTPERIEDPWPWYFRLHQPDAQSYLDALREGVK